MARSLSRIDAVASKRLGADVLSHIGQERLIVKCSRGLEPLLQRELLALGLTQCSGRYGAVDVMTLPGAHQRLCLMSRLADRVLVCLGDPAENIKTPPALYNYAMAMPWIDHMPFAAGMPMPNIKVYGGESEVVKDRVAAALTTHLKASIERSGDRSRHNLEMEEELQQTLRPPTVYVNNFNDSFQISVDCSGLLGLRCWKYTEDRDRVLDFAHDSLDRPVKKESPRCNTARLLDSQFAAIILKSQFLRILSDLPEQETLVLWDPFCGSGALLLEAFGIVLGLTPGRPTAKFPFMNFPSHDWPAYKNLRSEVGLAPHPSWRRLKLFGSDGFTPIEQSQNVKYSSANLQQFLSLLPQSKELLQQCHGLNPLQDFVREQVRLMPGILPKLRAAEIMPKNCFLLTAIPFRTEKTRSSQKLHQIYRDFGKLVQSRTDWKGVFVAAVSSSRFKELSGLDWVSHLKFESGECLGGGPGIELLEWVGSAASL